MLATSSESLLLLLGGKHTTEELYKKCLNDLDNHNGTVTNLEPDILECEVKCALGNYYKQS